MFPRASPNLRWSLLEPERTPLLPSGELPGRIVLLTTDSGLRAAVYMAILPPIITIGIRGVLCPGEKPLGTNLCNPCPGSADCSSAPPMTEWGSTVSEVRHALLEKPDLSFPPAGNLRFSLQPRSERPRRGQRSRRHRNRLQRNQ